MAKLKPCKTCEKEIADNAKTCPHCGVKDPGVTTKDALTGCLGLIVLAFIAIGLLSMCIEEEALDSSPSTEQSIKIPLKLDMGVNTQTFDENFNTFMRDLDVSFQLRIDQADYTGEGVSHTETAFVMLTDILFFRVLRRIDNQKIVSLILIFQNDGTENGIAMSLGVIGGMIAGLQPYVSPGGRGEILSIITDAVQSESTTEIIMGNVTYTAFYSPENGLMVTAENSNNP